MILDSLNEALEIRRPNGAMNVRDMAHPSAFWIQILSLSQNH